MMARQYASYAEYLQSDRWRDLRAWAVQRDGHRCRLCDMSFRLAVHHRRYAANWGEETLDDLTTLCERCHGIFHGAPPRPSPVGTIWLLGMACGFLVALLMLSGVISH